MVPVIELPDAAVDREGGGRKKVSTRENAELRELVKASIARQDALEQENAELRRHSA